MLNFIFVKVINSFALTKSYEKLINCRAIYWKKITYPQIMKKNHVDGNQIRHKINISIKFSKTKVGVLNC